MDGLRLLQMGLFIAVSAVIVVLSLPTLYDRKAAGFKPAHGFYRFFAFELLLLIVALNLPVWFRDPFTARQIVSWLLLLGSLALAIHGFWLLRQIGKPAGRIEDTTHLVTIGAYRYIRHPLYASLLLFGWGAFLKGPALLTAVLALAVTVALALTARCEEQENLARFGAEYAAYMRKTRMFVPYIL